LQFVTYYNINIIIRRINMVYTVCTNILIKNTNLWQ